MSDDNDQPQSEQPAPAEGGARTRGERVTTDRDVKRALLNMSPGELRSILDSKEAAAEGPTTPKLGPALEAVPAEDADELIEALSQGIAILDAGDEAARLNHKRRDQLRAEAQEKAVEAVRDCSPVVATAVERNSRYRSKPLRHSLEVARARLEQIHGTDA